MMQRTAMWWTATGLALVLSVGGAVWAQAQAPAPGSNGRVAIVDVQRILARSVAGTAAREQLEKDKAAMQRQLDGQKTELEKMRDELEKKGQLLSADARREKQDALERKVRDVRRLVDDLQAQLQKKDTPSSRRCSRTWPASSSAWGKRRASRWWSSGSAPGCSTPPSTPI